MNCKATKLEQGTISLNWIEKIDFEMQIYKKLLEDDLWLLVFQKLIFSTHFPLELWDRFEWIQQPMGTFSR